MITSVEKLDAANAAMKAEARAAAAAKLERITLHKLYVGRDWYTHRAQSPASSVDYGHGSGMVPMNIGDQVSEVDALFAAQRMYPGAEVSVARRAMGGIEMGLFPRVEDCQ